MNPKMYYAGILALILIVTSAQASVTGYIDSADNRKFLEVLVKGFVVKENDITGSYFAAKGFNLLNQEVVTVLKKDNCAYLKDNFKEEAATPETAFYVLSTWSLLSCPGKAYTDKLINDLKAVLASEKSTTADIHYTLETLTLLGQPIPAPAKVAQLLQARLKEDDSLRSLGHALHASTFLGSSGKFALDRIEDVVVQADEVDGRMLQWEGGLTTTSLLLTGLLRLPGAKPLTQTQADKFAAYLLTRKTVQTPRGVLALIQALKALTSSNVSPVSVTIVGSAQVTTDKPDLRIRITDLLGQQLKPAPSPVVAQSATRVADDVVVLSKQPLTPSSVPTEFVLPLRLEPGQYRLGLTAGSHSAALTVRVLGPITLNWLEVGVNDIDGTTAPQLTKLQYPSKLTSTLQIDSSQQLVAKLSLSRNVHQAFLRLYSGKKEIIFVAEPDSSQLYKVEVSLASELTDSGTYQLELIIGDSVISNPIRWNLGALEAKLGNPETSQSQTRGPKPEIKHLFRPAEKRPPQAVSMLFTGLAAAPLLLLVILWLKLGINFGNFSVLAMPFHLGLAAILGLFTLFWLKLDMFTTCGWLIPIGGFTFLTGHRLLSSIANQKKPEK